MICKYCGKDFSYTIIDLHMKRCNKIKTEVKVETPIIKEKEEVKTELEKLRILGKENKISGYHNMKEEKLVSKLSEMGVL